MVVVWLVLVITRTRTAPTTITQQQQLQPIDDWTDRRVSGFIQIAISNRWIDMYVLLMTMVIIINAYFL